MAQLLSPCASPGARRRSDGSVRECLFFPVLERNEQERLEALVRRRGGGAGARGDRQGTAGETREANPDGRPKRWTWGGPPGGGGGNLKTPPSHSIGSALPNVLPAAASPSQSRNVCDFLTPPTSDPPITKRLSSSSATLHSPERVSPGPQRALRGSPNRKSVTAPPDENKGPPVEKCPAPCTSDSPMRRIESPTTPTRSTSSRAQSKSLGTPKRVRSSRSRAQSPCSPGQYPPSPLRQRASDGSQDRPAPEGRGHVGTLERKSTRPDAPEKKIPKSSSKDLGTESPGTPTGRSVAGTTDADEACRLLAERRRLARVQKEQEERQRQEEDRLREEEELRRQEEAREQQERAARQAEEERERREEERRSREEEERRMKERRWKDMQDQLDREREEAFLRAQREVERKRQQRELQHLQEEQERLQRKKRIEEIMKRTRKNEADAPPPAQGVSVAGGQADGALEDNAGVDLVPVSEPVHAPLITLGPLETKSCGDELSDGVQSMDVSPVSRDELAQEFSPVTEGLDSVSVSNARTLEALLDLTAQHRAGLDPGPHPFPLDPGPHLPAASSAAAATLGDLNKNLLIQDYCGSASLAGPARPDSSSQLIHGLSSSPGALDIQ